MKVHLTRKPMGVHVHSLTSRLANMIAEEASKQLNGDRTCKLQNMNSCFAAEACNRGGTPCMELRELLAAQHPFVAITDTDSEGKMCKEEECRFVGCVSAGPASQMARSMYPNMEGNALLLSNLCVSEEYRKCGVGRELIDRIRSLNKPVYLLVAKRRGGGIAIEQAFESRVKRLQETYPKLGFRCVGESNDAHLFRDESVERHCIRDKLLVQAPEMFRDESVELHHIRDQLLVQVPKMLQDITGG